ncbi:hypothetical protein C5167_034202, partial [Papaver somniferum]
WFSYRSSAETGNIGNISTDMADIGYIGSEANYSTPDATDIQSRNIRFSCYVDLQEGIIKQTIDGREL